MCAVGRANSLARQHFSVDKLGTAGEQRHTAEVAPMIESELAVIRGAIARNKWELLAVLNEGKERRMARAAGELGVAVESMETAAQKILASAEVIDDCARALAPTLTDDYHHGLAQDVQDHVVRIYEACNFQDLAGQRIAKVIATLLMVEEQLAAMIERCSAATESDRLAIAGNSPSGSDLINGPRLDGDTGHVSQHDIDMMFA
jgi:chemotaxis protein CheZ